jgi:hypothetical protein
MPNRSKALKILFGIIIFSLVIPFSPPVSFAKAKICCKTKCSKMMGAMAESKQKPIKHCDHKNNPVNCCQKNCSNIITFEKSERISLVGKRIGVASPQLVLISLSALSHNVVPISKFPLKSNFDSYSYKIKSPPIFITISSFII